MLTFFEFFKYSLNQPNSVPVRVKAEVCGAAVGMMVIMITFQKAEVKVSGCFTAISDSLSASQFQFKM